MHKGGNVYKRNHGFTLIELMISLTILTMLLFTGSYVYIMLSSRWDKQLGSFSDNALIAKNIEATQRVLEGIHALVVVDNKKTPSFFFIGHSDSLLAITHSGIFSGDFPEIFRITSVPNTNGKFDLIYQAVSIENILLVKTDQEIRFDHQLTLFTNLDSATFNYLGWSSYKVKSFRYTTGDKLQWRNRYSGIDSQIMPEQLTFTIKKSGLSLSIPVELDNNTERWLSPYFGTDE
ncbi:PulJ/GspJ family protein [Thalassotalea piscium]|uniref:Prepilin-type N-terminal cleavage/methylation domain-containing protein n=1 Tax=Thalassotalea piscium TaxID=1230533 RepID=A0A7X0NG62_9GAMM|nr:prepilin-type N-terminal cleavage/methylation domain-containing protein [Thalassotalea piscium]MBB6542765.1 prepilin-type N-terminal cleavage/methylation domain-containing protein [Thalassotalea piscium]